MRLASHVPAAYGAVSVSHTCHVILVLVLNHDDPRCMESVCGLGVRRSRSE